MMAAKLYVSDELKDDVGRFVSDNSFPVELIDDRAAADFAILSPDGDDSKKMCDAKTWHAGGWIKCPTVWAMGKQHGLELMQTGSLLDMLNIRIRQCALGCFE